MNERDIEKYFIKLATEHGCLQRKLKWIGRNGAPDRVLFWPSGRGAYVELKAPGSRPTAQQEAEHRRLRSYGQTVLVVDSLAAVEALFTMGIGV